ncbi:hypothetical protein ACFV9W_03295 [Streptomyces sp. NPDC059897]|uniref:hypothetical protein n=1 Tax=Streptomyces sp. NPDC059897 TaxID=3346994 RepID=UPI00364C779B
MSSARNPGAASRHAEARTTTCSGRVRRPCTPSEDAGATAGPPPAWLAMAGEGDLLPASAGAGHVLSAAAGAGHALPAPVHTARSTP